MSISAWTPQPDGGLSWTNLDGLGYPAHKALWYLPPGVSGTDTAILILEADLYRQISSLQSPPT